MYHEQYAISCDGTLTVFNVNHSNSNKKSNTFIVRQSVHISLPQNVLHPNQVQESPPIV